MIMDRGRSLNMPLCVCLLSALFISYSSAGPKLSRQEAMDNGEKEIVGDLFRPGICQSDVRMNKFLSNDICGVNCLFDVDCPATMKCCPNRCGGTTCLPPFIEDPCTGVKCTEQGESCRVNEFNKGVCKCNTICPLLFQPVCGSDGKVYSNRCFMDSKACEKQKTITAEVCPTFPSQTEVVEVEETEPLYTGEQVTVDIDHASDLTTLMMTTKEPSHTTITSSSGTVEAEASTGLVLTVPTYQVVEVSENMEVTLFCDATSLTTPTYIWLFIRHDGEQPLAMFPGQRYDDNVVSSDGHFLRIENITESDLGIYTCMVGTAIAFVTAKFEVKLTELQVTMQSTATTPKSSSSAPSLGAPSNPVHGNEDKAEHPVLVGNDPICSLPVDQGNCFRKDNHAYWYYDISTQQCRPFTYSGCKGNENRFISYAECISVCPALPEDPCQHPMATGRCRAHIVRWAYDVMTRDCQQFVYGGCGQNGNNFATREDCATTCFDNEEKKEECLCVDPNFVGSFCSSNFVITGRVKQKLLVPGYGALLAVEVEEIIVEGNLTTTNATYLDGPLAVIRDVAQDACQCHDAKADGKLYIIMGYINREGFAVVDDLSYVKVASEKRHEKLHSLRSRADRRCSRE